MQRRVEWGGGGEERLMLMLMLVLVLGPYGIGAGACVDWMSDVGCRMKLHQPAEV